MNIYTKRAVWANWHIAILKFSVFAHGEVKESPLRWR